MVASPAEGQITEREVDQARRAGQAWVEEIAVIDPEMAEWQGAYLTRALPFHNPKGEVIAYMFAVERNGKTVGRVLVGSAAYGYSILEGTKAPPFSIPSPAEVSSILRKEHGLQIPEITLGEPVLLLLNILRGFYAVWELETRVAGINLITARSFTVPNLQALEAAIPCPVEYKAAKTVTRQSLLMSPYWEPLWDWGEVLIREHHLMKAWDEIADLPPAGYDRAAWCGPTSGVSIGVWKRDADGDGGLHDCEAVIYDVLEQEMHTLSFPWGWTYPWHYGPGFVNYGAAHQPPLKHPEHFTWSYRSTFSDIQSDIASGWPLGLCGWMDIAGEKKAHWVAVKGWGWVWLSHYVIVTDSATRDDNRWLCWDALNEPAGPIWFLYLIRIADTDIDTHLRA
jgi:hypothetical protein